jgi:hypothetical protein
VANAKNDSRTKKTSPLEGEAKSLMP